MHKHQWPAIFLLILSLPIAPVLANPVGVISVADKPVRLIRGTTLYRASAGIALQKGDLLETGTSSMQVETSSSIMMALAPDSRVFINDITVSDNYPRVEIVVLSGWLKLTSKLPQKNTPLLIIGSTMQMRGSTASVIVHSDADTTKVFVEEGGLEVAEIDYGAKPHAWMKVKQEQYAWHTADQSIKVTERPARDFIAEMPRAFRDPLMPVVAKLPAKMAMPTKEREVDYADIDAWLTSSLPIKKALVRQFLPRLQNSDFRQSLDARLGQSPEWKLILHPIAR